MKTGFLHRLWRCVCFIFLVVVCGGQVYSSAHLHHFHSGDAIAYKVSAHPLAVAVDHSSTHHHHDDPSSHEDEKDHSYKKLAVWRNASRAKEFVDVLNDYSGLPVLADFLPVTSFEVPKFSPVSRPHPKEYSRPFKAIRGPPLFV